MNTLQLLGVGLENSLHRTRVLARELRRFGGERWYWRLRLACLPSGLYLAPRRLAEREGPKVGVSQADLTYGETSILAAWEILHRLAVGPDDYVVDLGCGRGVVLLVARLAFGAGATGVEVLPALARVARSLIYSLSLEEEVFVHDGDARELDLPPGTVYFAAPTTLEDASWFRLQRRLHQAPSGTRAVTVSIPLPNWEPLWEEELPYSWGMARTYAQVKR